MSEVFISYKREDEARVSALVRALERHGLACWWDRGLVAGENWRGRIQSELDEARAVVVCWTERTAGSEGLFVRDEAARAQRAGKLVPVLLDNVTPPLGFGELQSIDLSHFARGPASALSGGRLGASHRDPFVLDLVAAVRATLAGQPAPAPRGRWRRLVRRLSWGSLATGAAALAMAFASNTLGLQEQVCNVDVAQPGVSDACGYFSLGGRPTQAERLAWAARPTEPDARCDGLRDFIQRYPGSHFAPTASSLLAARRVEVEQRWTPGERPLPLRETASASPDRSAAEMATLDAARAQAERLCRNFETTGLFRVRQAQVEPQQWDCHPEGKKAWVCAVDGVTRCQFDEGVEIKHERCE
jgi:hypothetical protein